MRLLWAKSDFLHPTTRGGQIRTLEILKRLHKQHEVHYVALHRPGETEGIERSSEYCTRAYPIAHDVPDHYSPAFAAQLVRGLFSPLPVAIFRYRSAAMRTKLTELATRVRFDGVVCDFLAPSANFERLDQAVLFQHNVETALWQRHAEHAGSPAKRAYLALQANRMFAFEREICRCVRRIIAVSFSDAETMKRMFGVERVTVSPTGVDGEYFQRRQHHPTCYDLCFIGSMDWLPNADAILHFYRDVLPLIRQRIPQCSLAVVGRNPTPEISRLAAERGITVTGTVADVRPYLWSSRVSIVPLRIGGGTRLKIYEAMAAGTPVVSTSIGAEGLAVAHPETIRLADSPEAFAEQCVRLIENHAERERLATAAAALVLSRFSWDTVSRDFANLVFG